MLVVFLIVFSLYPQGIYGMMAGMAAGMAGGMSGRTHSDVPQFSLANFAQGPGQSQMQMQGIFQNLNEWVFQWHPGPPFRIEAKQNAFKAAPKEGKDGLYQ